MSDEQVIKALEVCSNEDLGCEDGCPYTAREYDGDLCCLKLKKDALDLVKRQQAEIERVNKEVDRLSQCVMYHDGHIVDAIREFAEKLKEYYPSIANGIDFTAEEVLKG